MLSIRITNDKQKQTLQHVTGPLELGRGPQRRVSRFEIQDGTVSRDQLQVEELPGSRLYLENLSLRNVVFLADRTRVGIGEWRELKLPVSLTVGCTQIKIEDGNYSSPLSDPNNGLEDNPFLTIDPFLRSHDPRQPVGEKGALGEAPTAKKVMDCLETVLALQQAAASSQGFYEQTARALVDLVGLDLGLVLLRQETGWTIGGCAVADDRVDVVYSHTLLAKVVQNRQTFYQDLSCYKDPTASLRNIGAVVVSPIFGLQGEVAGVLYGMRTHNVIKRGGITPLEAQVVQLLAAAVSANLARSAAVRTRIQFEQFFSPELVRELERDPALLEGRNQDVTILFSDLRGFTNLSERLGAQNTCRLVRDMMERLSERIVEHGGVIVDYAGDSILAMWNAPAPQPDHVSRACHAALAMLKELPGLNARWQDLVSGQLQLGIGVNTGPAQVGNTGSSRKFKYGPHGHTVNLASRVQDTTKRLGVPVLITAAARELLPATFTTRRLGQVRLPGVHDPVVLFELHGPEPSLGWLARRDIYETALHLYETAQWSQACQALMPLLEMADPDDSYNTSTIKLMKRIWECMESRPHVFDPVIEVHV